jgi:hypothetical protein
MGMLLGLEMLHGRLRSSLSGICDKLLWKRDEWKTALTSFLVVFTFVICWLPYFIIIILESVLNKPESIPAEVETVSILLAMSSCAINPLVYVFLSLLFLAALNMMIYPHNMTMRGNANETETKNRV